MRKTKIGILYCAAVLLCAGSVLAESGRGTLRQMEVCNERHRGETFVVLNGSDPQSCDRAQATGDLILDCICKNTEEDPNTFAWTIRGGSEPEVVDLSGYALLNGANFVGPLSIDHGGDGGDMELSTGAGYVDIKSLQIDGGSAAVSRTVRVDADAVDNGTTVFNTIKEAVDYVNAQTPSAADPWTVLVQGGGTYSEDPFTIPAHTDVSCNNGGSVYGFGYATIITGNVVSGDFITMKGGSIRNCMIEVTGNATSERHAIHCDSDSLAGGGFVCTLDHVGLRSWNLSSSADDIGFYQSDGSADLYYFVITFIGGNTNSTAIKLAATADGVTLYNNGIIADGGLAQGKGIWSLKTGSNRVEINNVRIGALYSDNLFTTDLVNDGTAIFYVSDSVFQRTATSGGGTFVIRDRRAYGSRATPPNTCNADNASSTYYDSTINSECTCNGTNYVLSHDMATTTGCS